MDWSLIITDTINATHGILEVNGQQTFIKLDTDIKGNSDSIAVIYRRHIDGSDENLKSGDTLFTLKNSHGKIITTWQLIGPRLTNLQTKRCECFNRITNTK
jgi:hypothetical protein